MNYASTLNRDNVAGYAYERIGVTGILYRMYATGDLRRDWAIAPYKYVTANGVTTKSFYTKTQIYERTVGKWRREYETATPKNRTYNSTNFPVIRYADVV